MPSQWISTKGVFSYKNLVHAVAGAAGSSFAITTFYPLDAARTRVQVDENRKAKYSPEVVLEVFEEEGIEGLYRGWFPVVTSICCSNFVYFYVFNGLKAVCYGRNDTPYPAKDLLLAFLAGVTNVLSTTPLWVANTRLKLQGTLLRRQTSFSERGLPHYYGMFHALKTIYRQEGLFALWCGTLPSVVLASNPAVQFMVYEALKRRYAANGNAKNVGGFVYFMMGALSKMVATFITYPLQVIQARLRAGHNKRGNGFRGMLYALDQIYEKYGFKGLYKGLELKLTQTVLMAALMFFTYEKIASIVFRIMRAEKLKTVLVAS
ncbi:hypothetical protein CAPTEDRAFT_226474 [Capitella teleta]|uniref:Uncharacterized protein n=1 Tax=Capitella teleta TaxID=283909 RepID=R7UVP2_CAPTE|nr:hypothetical protein CAPTEDRAFT_226474 [Capitella teleta]|eukprot:ELU07461.1 hypothetical protein CAPTEDRAFT_226474 [Capitella teleta]